jgi:hypothetical protein
MTTRGSLWERVASNLQEWYADAKDWTGEKARIGVKKVDMVGIQHNIKRTMTHLGGRVYDLLQRGEDVAMDVEVKRLVATLRGFEKELADREHEIEDLKTRRQDDTTSADTAPGTTTTDASDTPDETIPPMRGPESRPDA